MLASGGLQQIFRYHGFAPGAANIDDGYDDDEEEEYGILGLGRRLPRRRGPPDYPKVPSEEGMKLMRSGNFGSEPNYMDVRLKRKKSLAERMMWRELGIDGQGLQRSRVPSISQVGATLRTMRNIPTHQISI